MHLHDHWILGVNEINEKILKNIKNKTYCNFVFNSKMFP